MRLPRLKGLAHDPFVKVVLRTIRGSLGRFLAILGIVALGCGFYAGLQMCGPDMRRDADALYDGCNLYDIRVVSTMGFSQDDVDRLGRIQGVDGAMPAISCDVMAGLGNSSHACRISSIDVDTAEQAQQQGANAILSDDGRYLNRVFLREGRWPEKADECVITADKPIEGVEVGATVEALYGTSDLDDLLSQRTFKIVGTVSSPSYPYTGSFGSTTLGTGMIMEYLYVVPEAFAEDVPFTEVYLTVEGARDFESGSDEYEERVDEVEKAIEAQADDLAAARRDDLVADAQAKVDEGREELEKKREEADDELAAGQAKLDEARAKLAEGEKSFEDGVAQWEEGRATAERQLEDAANQYNEGVAKVDEMRAQLEADEAYAEARERELLELAKAQDVYAASLISARLKLRLQEAQLDTSLRTYDARIEAQNSIARIEGDIANIEARLLETGTPSALETSRALANISLEAALNSLEQATSNAQTRIGAAIADAAVESARQRVDELERQIADTTARLEEATSLTTQKRQLASDLAQVRIRLDLLDLQLRRLPAEAELRARLESVTSLEAAIDDLMSFKTGLVGSRLELAIAENQLSSGKEKYESGRSSAVSELDSSRQKLDEGAAELERARAEIADGQRKLDEGKAEAEASIADAVRQLDDAQKEIDEVETPEIYVLDRAKNEGLAAYDADSFRIDAIADVFPLMFFLVAALVSLSTMARMVMDERIEVGTYKALGYSTAKIAAKYLAYAGIASTIGAIIGIAVLSQFLPLVVTLSYGIIYTIPVHPFPLPVHPSIALASGGIGVGVTLVATFVAVLATLRETTATLMLPRAPVAGKRILLERVGFVWRRLSFSWKVTLRNIFRGKARFLMTVIGISGTTALILVGFALHDAIWDVIDCQFGPIFQHDLVVGLDDEATSTDVDAVVALMRDNDGVSGISRIQTENMLCGLDANEGTTRAQVLIPHEPQDLTRHIVLRERASQEPVSFGNDSVVVTEKLANLYGIGVGDDICLFEQDAIGNVHGDTYRLRISGITENYVGNYIYVGRDAWTEVSDETPVYQTVYAKVTDDDAVRDDLAASVRDLPHVSTVSYITASLDIYSNTVSVVDSVVIILIVSAGLLAFIVVYNLTNINISERIREIASLKVLGFTKGEVYSYVFREIVLLGILGDALGLAFGTWLANFVIVTAEVDNVMFGRTIYPFSYGVSFGLTLVFIIAILVILRKKLDNVNMVESLKSVD